MTLISDIKSTQWTLDINKIGGIVTGIDSIKQCVLIILTTQKGTDPLRPDFGCGAFENIDLPVNTAVPEMIKEMKSSLAKYEKRIENVLIKAEAIELSKYRFKVSYKLKDTTINDQINITYGGASNT